MLPVGLRAPDPRQGLAPAPHQGRCPIGTPECRDRGGPAERPLSCLGKTLQSRSDA
jgi:hypothetical protein